MKVCGATPAIDPDIYLPHAMQLPSALKEKGKEEQFQGKAIPETVTGKARISPQGATPIRPLRHCTKNPPLPPNKFGGMTN